MRATAGTTMCHGTFSFWCSFKREEDGKDITISGYLRKGDLWTDAKAAGANTSQMREMKDAMAAAPKRRNYTR